MDAIKELIFTPIGIATLVIVALYFFVRSSSKTFDLWEKKGIPYIKPKPFFGSVLDKFGKPFHENEVERYKQYGRLYGDFEGSAALLSVADPDHLRNILVKDFQFFTNRRGLKTGDTITERMLQLLEGEDWKRVRTIVTPTFTTGKIKRMMSIFKDCSKVIVGNYRKFAEKGEPVDTKKIYGAFTMDIIASAAFSTKLDSHNDPNNKFVKVASGVFHTNVNIRFVFYLLLPRLMKFFKVPIFPPEGVNFFSDVTMRIINERRRTGQTRNDFLQLLMDAADEAKADDKNVEKSDEMLENYETDINDQVFKNFKPKKALTNDELVAQCVIFFLAGFETTASTLAFASYHLALNPEIQDKLVEELDEAVIQGNGELTYESIQSMKYLDNVISETLRINSPAVRLERIASEDYKLGDTGLVIPKNTVITVPIYAMHRDPEFFPNPEKFDPDRFSAEERSKRNPYTFMPFGAGPRNCVGMRFALVEAKVCLAYVLSHFKIKRCSQTKVPLEFLMGNGLLQAKEVTLQMVPRENVILKD